MRITIDVASVQDTTRVLTAAADEYDRTAALLQAADGLGGVTGSERGWLVPGVQSVAAQLRSVAAQHRATAADLVRRCDCAADSASPVYAGISLAATMVELDRNGDGVIDSVAMDLDADGFYETFAVDWNNDGAYETFLIQDHQNNLVGAGFDADLDGHIENVIAVQTASGPLLASDLDGDNTYDVSPWVVPAPSLTTAIVGGTVIGGTVAGGVTGYVGGTFLGGSSGTGVTGYVGGTFHGGASGTSVDPFQPLWNAQSNDALMDAYDSINDSTRVWFDDVGVEQPELGDLDTYNWMEDPRLDTDNDGVENKWDSSIRDYDES